MSLPKPSRGEVWFLNLDPTRDREQAGSRPALVLSVDAFNHGPTGLVRILPVTCKAKGIPFHVAVAPPEAGIRQPRFIVSRSRLGDRWGTVAPDTMAAVEDRLRILMGL